MINKLTFKSDFSELLSPAKKRDSETAEISCDNRGSVIDDNSDSKSDTFEGGVESAWRILDVGRRGKVSSRRLITYLANDGILLESDPRLALVLERLQKINGVSKNVEIEMDLFRSIVEDDIGFINRILEGNLVIPDFDDFVLRLESIYENTKNIKDGTNARYIPELANVDPDNFAISVCTIDGQRWSIGDFEERFSIQSCCKPISYLIALQEHGDEKVHFHVGTEPSGKEFNMLVLKDVGTIEDGEGNLSVRKIPHNPLINSGAIMCCSLIHPQGAMADRFNKVMLVWQKLCGSKISFGNSVYLSEKSNANRNWCLGYMMQEYHSFPERTKLEKTLDFYFQCCSMEASCEQTAILAATLANGGTQPLSEERIFDPKLVRNCLSIMLTSGMYDYSGEWAFSVGLPAKSGVGGCVYIVVPNVLGLAVWSPRLDKNGNSVKGIMVAKELTKIFNFHHFDHLCATNNEEKGKINPKLRIYQEKYKKISAMLFAAANGDVKELRRLYRQGGDLFASDYDARTSLHLACSEGHHRVVEYLVSKTVHLAPMDRAMKLSPLDRWARTPLNDAISSDYPECAKHLQRANAQKASEHASKSGSFRVLNIEKSNICKKRIEERSSPFQPQSLPYTLTRASLEARKLWSPMEGALTNPSTGISPSLAYDRSPCLGNVKLSVFKSNLFESAARLTSSTSSSVVFSKEKEANDPQRKETKHETFLKGGVLSIGQKNNKHKENTNITDSCDHSHPR